MRVAFVLSPVALILLVFFASWMVHENRHLRNELRQAGAEQAQLRRQQQETAETLSALLKVPPPSSQNPPNKKGEQVAEARTPAITASLVLMPGLFRGVVPLPGESRSLPFGGPKTLVVPPLASRVRLDLELESGEYPSYRITLELLDGSESWQKQDLKSQPNRTGGKAITLQPPVDFLKSGDYVIELQGIGSDGNAHDISSYAFRVERPTAERPGVTGATPSANR
jgi:hypothetical protein